MSAAEAVSDRILPNDYFGQRPLRDCRGRKRDSVVVIEVDTDDYGELIILDVPDSFREKFRKRPKHVISIDDDDDGGEGGEGSSSDATTSDRCSPRTPAQAARASTSAFVDEDVDEGNAPVKLSKSKRTYSGKSLPRNRYGPGPGSEGDVSESDCSDCELVEGSGKLREQWEKASFRRRHDARCAPPDFGSKAGSSTPSNDVHYGAGESTHDEVEPLGQQSSVRESSLHNDVGNAVSGSSHTSSEGSSDQDYDPMEVDEDEQAPRTCDDISSGLVDKEKGSNSEPMGDGKFTNEVFSRDYPSAVTKESSQVVECNNATLLDRRQGAEVPSSMPSDLTYGCGHANGLVLSSEQNNVITDRQKMKETEEYKLAMEEELAARQQQLLLQNEEARKLKNRKKAEKMRLMMNERRQKDRLEEIRQTRRKDEENLNLKEKYRVEVKKELKMIEAMCGDMGSLLRYLGIDVGGGPFPSPNEVQAAYKRACLKFHPDRISATDLRQQVEAEEKFKLISNMKDKLMLRLRTSFL